MEYRLFNDTYVIRLDRGEEVMTVLTDLCQREGIQLGSVAGIGAADRAILCLYDVVEKAYSKQVFNEPMEITSLMGTVSCKQGKTHLHLHATLSDANMQAHGGHVNALVIGGTGGDLPARLAGPGGPPAGRGDGTERVEFSIGVYLSCKKGATKEL